MFKWKVRNLAVAALTAVAAATVLGGASPASAAYGLRIEWDGRGYCLDSDYGQNAYVHTCNNGNFQRWYLNGVGLLRNVETGLCLDSSATRDNNSTAIYTHPCNGGSFQKWRVTSRGLIQHSHSGRYLYVMTNNLGWPGLMVQPGSASIWHVSDWYRV